MADISKITLPGGDVRDIKDATARAEIEALQDELPDITDKTTYDVTAIAGSGTFHFVHKNGMVFVYFAGSFTGLMGNAKTKLCDTPSLCVPDRQYTFDLFIYANSDVTKARLYVSSTVAIYIYKSSSDPLSANNVNFGLSYMT